VTLVAGLQHHLVGVNPLPARSPRRPASHGSLTCPAHARHRGDHASSYTTPRDTIARGANLHRALAGRPRPRSPAWPGRSGRHGSLIGAMVSRVPALRAPGASVPDGRRRSRPWPIGKAYSQTLSARQDLLAVCPHKVAVFEHWLMHSARFGSIANKRARHSATQESRFRSHA
jgi:hypothetical protein